ncbi:MAG: hypothetical protein J7L91_05035 [Candidatus Korarchaeota archaeon]|nr:hypothetical protein [Candidatus Korarchaeota archaeon]
MSEFLEWVREWFGVDLSDLYLIRSGKKRIRGTTMEAGGLEIGDVIRGIYLAKKAPYGYIISIEGSFIVGKWATKHVVELDDEQFSRWMKGEDLVLELPERGVYIVRYGPIFAGSGFYSGKVLQNLIPKSRTIEES